MDLDWPITEVTDQAQAQEWFRPKHGAPSTRVIFFPQTHVVSVSQNQQG